MADDDDFVPAKEEILLRKEGIVCVCLCVWGGGYRALVKRTRRWMRRRGEGIEELRRRESCGQQDLE